MSLLLIPAKKISIVSAVEMSLRTEAERKAFKATLDELKKRGYDELTKWGAQYVVIANDAPFSEEVCEKTCSEVPINMFIGKIHLPKGKNASPLHWMAELMRAMLHSLKTFTNDPERSKKLIQPLWWVFKEFLNTNNNENNQMASVFGDFSLFFIHLVVFDIPVDIEDFKKCKLRKSLEFFVAKGEISYDPTDEDDHWVFLKKYCNTILSRIKEICQQHRIGGFLATFNACADKEGWREDGKVREMALFLIAGYRAISATLHAVFWALFREHRTKLPGTFHFKPDEWNGLVMFRASEKIIELVIEEGTQLANWKFPAGTVFLLNFTPDGLPSPHTPSGKEVFGGSILNYVREMVVHVYEKLATEALMHRG